jgi:ATP-dependent helicase HrpB
MERLRADRSSVLVAPPGAGKSTRVPPAILRAGLLSPEHPNLVVLQPRRVAARATAQRIADENGWMLGREVGYHIRFDRQLTDRTPLRILTEGIFTRQLIADPFLEGIGAVVLDEFHERHLDTDLAISFLKEIRQTVRPDLLILVMSATIEAEPVARFLDDCPIVRAEGRTFPVAVEYVEPTPGYRELSDGIARVVKNLVSGSGIRDSGFDETSDPNPGTRIPEPGHLLIFLPGMDEIRRTMQRLEPLAQAWDADLLPLHGALPPDQQYRALAPSSRRKIILATNIAETSLTIDGVRTVIDGGYARVARYDARRGLNRLDLERISQASADQRAGRAGRTAPGQAIRLWSQKQQHALPAYTEPDIRRVDLAGTVLALHAWGSADPRRFGWYEAPLQGAIEAAENLLEMLGAVGGRHEGEEDARPAMSALGRQILRLPLHPRLGRLLIAAAQWGMLEEGCAMAALLSEKDILPRRRGGETVGRAATGDESDLLYRLELLNRSERHSPAELDRPAVRQVLQTKRQLMRIGRRLSAGGPANPTPVEPKRLQALLLAYPDRVARRRQADPQSATLVGGGAVRLAHESIVRRSEFFLALDARHDPASPTRQALVHLASAIEMDWLEQFFPRQVRREQVVIYDPQRDRVLGLSRLYYRDLLLKEETGVAVDPIQAGEALMSFAGPIAEEIFRADPAADQVLNRILFLQKQGAGFGFRVWGFGVESEPVTRNPEPAPPLADLLSTLAPGKRSLAQLKQSDLAGLLRGAMPYARQRQLDHEAPTSITLPTGREWRLTYPRDGSAPVLAVKLQQLLGLNQTPRLINGRVPIRLHLLAPNGRPVQITDDLASFWKNTYPQVRKDLRARYPKHAWPEKPGV